jgi:peptide/nickel transport system substrate-binding protein
VVAEDVRFSIALLKDPAVASPHVQGVELVDSASVTDSLTAVVWFNRKSPEQFFKLVYNLTIVPAHLLADVPRDKMRESAFARNPVGNGRFRFSRWIPGALVEVVADTANFRGRPSIDKAIWSVSPDPTAMLARLVTGEADMVEFLRGPAVGEAAKAPNVRLVPYQGLDYGFALFNQRDPAARATPHPIFRDPAVRRALTMAIDRQAVLKNVLDTLGYLGIGPTVRAQWSSDTSIAMIPHDVEAAKALLDSAGWRDADGDGVREKGGRPLAFALLTPSSSAPRSQSAVLLQAQWKEVGAKVDIDVIEFGAFVERISAGRFDVVMHGLHADPSPGDLLENFGSPTPPTRFGKNHSGYSSAAVDAAIDSARTEFDMERAKALYRRAYKQIIDDAAAIFLYEVRNVAGIHTRIDPGAISPMGWWTTLADWKIAPDQRLDRDRVPLSATAPSTAGDSAPAAK